MIDKSVTGSDNLSSSGSDSTPISTVPGGGSIIPKSDAEVGAGQPEKANTPGQGVKQPSETETLQAENAKLRAGQSTLEKRIDSLRQIITKRQEGSTTPPARSPQQPTLYRDDAGNLFTLDPKTGQATPYTGEAATSGSEANYDERDTQIANLQLKDGVREVLDNYPSLSPEMKKQIGDNPFGFWMWNYPDKRPETVSADEVLLDIEFKLMESSNNDGNNVNNVPGGAANAGNQPGQGFSVAPSNRGPQVDLGGSPLADYVDEAGNFDIQAIWDALERKELDIKDLEKIVGRMPMSDVLKGQKAASTRGMFSKMI